MHVSSGLCCTCMQATRFTCLPARVRCAMLNIFLRLRHKIILACPCTHTLHVLAAHMFNYNLYYYVYYTSPVVYLLPMPQACLCYIAYSCCCAAWVCQSLILYALYSYHSYTVSSPFIGATAVYIS
jgi:hypothetical protein